jgi:arylsulfatase A-like enzyme
MRRSSSSCPNATVLALVLLILACSQPGDPEPPTDRLSGSASGRNLILITVDTLRADRLGVNDHTVQGTSPSPRIDALMTSGVHFANTIAPRAITWPSLASVLTGLYPSGHGAYENGYELVEGIVTLPMILQAQGYQSGRFLSNWCRASRLGWNTTYCSHSADSEINPEVVSWLDEIDTEQPFFLWVHYFGAHSPYYNGGERAAKVLNPGYDGPVAPKKGWLNRIMTEEIPLDDADLRHLDALYDAAVMGTDDYVGRLLAALESRQLIDDSVLVFLADHGEELYDHNRYIYHACSVYQSGLHVPMAIAVPGVLEGGGVVGHSVELMDVAPTVLDLLGATAPAGLHGSSLVPYLERPEASGAGKPAFSEYPPANIHTVQVGGWKLVDNPDLVSPFCLPDAPEEHYPLERVELYDLVEDPLETTNLAEQYPEKVAELQLEALGYVVN